jgi:glucuronoarabinoxylan endo-1,4-beta-xylanase
MKRSFVMSGLALMIGALSLIHCKSETSTTPVPEEDPAENLPQATIQIDASKKYQTIDGFGFFGGQDVWWRGAASMWNDTWGDKVISDLGITIWRNEIAPPAIPGANQDADWAKQLPVVRGLKAKAAQHGVSLKFVATVWSPPADLKWASSFAWAGDVNAKRWADPSVSTKNGGTLNPNKYGEFADYLKKHISLYKDEGIDLYGLSLQNEPAFTQTFNSCTYTVGWYTDLLNNTVPSIKAAFPAIQIFGSENMLATESKDNNLPWFYHTAIKGNAQATGNVDILAVHGYNDGVLPTSGAELVKMWNNHTEHFAVPMKKKVWMSETSGYADSWNVVNGKPGAMSLGLDILTALNYGNVNAWIWWQGSELDGIGDYNLMSGTTGGKKYYASKHYYRYIRPGAVRVGATFETNTDDMFVTAYEHAGKKTNTIVIINAGPARAITLQGGALSAEYQMYRTSVSNSENCRLIGTVKSGNGNRFVLPEKSIVTLQAGGDAL